MVTVLLTLLYTPPFLSVLVFNYPPGYSKINKNILTCIANHNILRLNILVNHSTVMDHLKSLYQFSHQGCNLISGKTFLHKPTEIPDHNLHLHVNTMTPFPKAVKPRYMGFSFHSFKDISLVLEKGFPVPIAKGLYFQGCEDV